MTRSAAHRLSLVLLLLAAAAVLLAGCGRYGFTGKSGKVDLPPEVRTVAIRKVVNPTMYTWLPAQLIAQFRDEITQRHQLEWTDVDKADALIDLQIKNFYVSSALLTKEETTLQYSASVNILASIYRRSDNALITQKASSWGETFLSVSDKTARERTVELAVQRLADQLGNAY